MPPRLRLEPLLAEPCPYPLDVRSLHQLAHRSPSSLSSSSGTLGLKTHLDNDMPRRRINNHVPPLHPHQPLHLVPERQRVALDPPDQRGDLGPAGLRAEVDGQPVGAGARDEVGRRGGGGPGRRGDDERLEEGAGAPQAEEGCRVHCEGC